MSFNRSRILMKQVRAIGRIQVIDLQMETVNETLQL